MNEQVRYCECGARLAADQPVDRCSPCARRRLLDDRPPSHSAEFWRGTDLRAALASQHFGRVFKAYRYAHEPTITQATLGRWLGMTQKQVSRLERPDAPPPSDLRKLRRWAATLGVPERLLWFAPAHTSTDSADTVTTVTLDDSEGDDVRRRQFLKAASTGISAVGASLLGATSTRASALPRPGSNDVEIVRDMTAAFRRLDNRYGGGHSRATTTITVYLTSTVTPMLNDTSRPTAARGELFSAAAELHQVAGWIAYDIGNAEEGQRHLREALKLSQDAGDDALEAEMLAAMSHHAAFHRNPAVALDMALAARRTAKRSGLVALQAEAAVMEAHGHALQANGPECLGALREAERAFERFSIGEGPVWLTYFDGAYLSAKFAHTFRDLGRPVEAERFARRSLEMSDGYERGRLFNTALLASTLADQGRVDEACAEATRAVRMSEHVKSIRGGAYLADVGRRLEPHRTDRHVRGLYDLMNGAGVPTPA